MRIEIRGRNVEVTDELREHVHKRFARIGRQLSDLARLEVELMEERNPSIRDNQVCEAHLHVKGAHLTATEASPEMLGSIKACSEDVARQVKRNRELRRRRWQSRRRAARLRGRAA
ncbi:MAG TPA: ribosome-associated translation inhibitor RaiA [Solirubrobacterales bacterium]